MTPSEMERTNCQCDGTVIFIFIAVVFLYVLVFMEMRGRYYAHTLHHPECVECYTQENGE